MPQRPITVVFVGSTRVDLIDHRKVVAESILSCGLYPMMMEYFPSIPEESVAGCLGLVQKSDIYVGIFAHRYGYIPPGNTLSITEQEYDEAKRLKLPQLCFLIDESHPWADSLREDDPGKSKLVMFKQKIDRELMRQTFTTPDHLGRKVVESLFRLFSDPPASLKYQIGGFTLVDVTKPIKMVETEKARVVVMLNEDDIQKLDKVAFLEALKSAYDTLAGE